MKPSCMRCGGPTKKNKMAVGGTTTKRIIKKSTGGMYGIPQENLGTSGQYGFAQKGGTHKMLNSKMQKGGTKPPCPPGYHMEGSDCVKDQKAFDSLGAKLGFFGPLTGALGLGAKILIDRNKNKIPRLKEREANLVSRGKKAVDEGREKKANRLLGRAAKVENRIITLEEKKAKSSYKKGGATKNTKLAAVATPKNKITRADVLTRILKKKKN